MKYPLVIVALLYAAGVAAADLIDLPVAGLLTVSIIAALGCFSRYLRRFLLGVLLFLAGAANLTWRTAILSPYDLRSVLGEQAAAAELRGWLVETPEQRLYTHDQDETWRTIAQVDVSALRLPEGSWQPARGRVAVSTPGIVPPVFCAGQPIEVSGVLREPRGPMAEGLFDYHAYLERLGIHYQLQVESTNDWTLAAHRIRRPLADRFTGWARAALARGLPEQDEPLRLLWAMALGWRTALSGEVSEPFMRSGTMHVFAISGLHIALIAGILVSVLRMCRVPRVTCGLLVVPFLWFYTAATGWQASAVRSTLMMTIVIGGWSLRRPSELLNSLAAAALIILLCDPRQLFQASFQLSFFVVLSLALFTPVLRTMALRLAQPDPLVPAELVPAWQRGLRAGYGWVAGAAVTSLAAWLGSIPLVAHYFHFFTPVTLGANLVVVPLSGFALASSLASLLTTQVLPGVAELFNHAAWFFMWLMSGVSKWAATLPGGCFHVRGPSALGFVLYYGILISLLAGWLAKARLRLWVASTLSILAAVAFVRWNAERSGTRLTVLPLNGGDACHVDAPGRNRDALIDCGNESAVRFVVLPFLRAQGVNRLPALALTHGDVRHVGGAEVLLERMPVGEIGMSSVPFRSPAYRQLEAKLGQEEGRIRRVHRGDRLGSWAVLHPVADDRFSRGDDGALVLLGDFEGTRILLLSDLGAAGQRTLFERNPELRTDIVVAGLPAQGDPLPDALVEAIQPRVIIIADSLYPAYSRASERLCGRLRRTGVPVLYTRQTGAITIRLAPKGWRVTGMDGTRVAGRQSVARARAVHK